MESIKMNTSKEYEIRIGSGLIDTIADEVKRFAPLAAKVVIVTDVKVMSLYNKKVNDLLRDAGYNVLTYMVEKGDNCKSYSVFEELINFFTKQTLTKTDIVIALGGGAIGDLSAFACALFKGGIQWINIPTTLISMTDSAVTGKGALNTNLSKDLVSIEYPPCIVLEDIDCLKSLDVSMHKSGLAESYKSALINGGKCYEAVKELINNKGLESLLADDETLIRFIKLFVECKKDRLNELSDEYAACDIDTLGKTIGHCVEMCNHFKLSYGDCLGIGIMIAVRYAFKLGLTDAGFVSLLEEELDKLGIMTKTQFPPRLLRAYMIYDPYRIKNDIVLFVPVAVGEVKKVTIPAENIVDELAVYEY